MGSLCTATKSGPLSMQLEKARLQRQRPNAAKNKIKKENLKNKQTSKQKNPKTPGIQSSIMHYI